MALTKLKHVNIVGYVNAWKENPPRDWIKQKEEMLERRRSDQEDDVDKGLTTSEEITSEESNDLINDSASILSSQSNATHMSFSTASTNHLDGNDVILLVTTETNRIPLSLELFLGIGKQQSMSTDAVHHVGIVFERNLG